MGRISSFFATVAFEKMRKRFAGRRQVILMAAAAAAAGGTWGISAVSNAVASVGDGTTVFSVLNNSPAVGTALPPSPLVGATKTVLATAGGSGSVYALETSDGNVCVMVVASNEDEAVACDPAAVANSGTVVSTLTAAGIPRLTAFVPDGVTAVTFNESGGASVMMPVENNVADFASSALVSVTVPSVAGPVTTPFAPELAPFVSPSS